MTFKRILPDVIAVLAFAVLSFAYFFPADIEGRILFQHDTAAGAGAGQEAVEYREETGRQTRWTNSVFGGMPTYQISPSYESNRPLQGLQRLYQLFLPNYVSLTFILLLGFYILLRVFGIPVWLAGLGAVAWAFSSYFFILISAGHIWKFVTLAYIPPTMAGIVLAYRGRVLWGAVLTALFVALQVASNHVQMTYYFLFVILFIVGAYFEEAWRGKRLPQFFRTSAVLLAAALIGITANLSNLYHTYTYSKETMRGKSELVQADADKAQQSSSGLDRDYITQWSYGIGETWTLLVPDFKGGSSSIPLSRSDKAMEKAKEEYRQMGIYDMMGQYFGDQPFTAGPVYVGAFILFLFVLGCFVVKGPLKWALVGATGLSIVLSWGKNFMPLTDFFIDYVPMYSKFRAVSSILVIAEFTIPLLAVFALKRIIEEPSLFRKHRVGTTVSLLLTAGVALLLVIAPDSLGNDFTPVRERTMLADSFRYQLMEYYGLSTEQAASEAAQMAAGIQANLSEMRGALVGADALRSLLVIGAGCALLLLYSRGVLRRSLAVGGITLLCLGDLWGVNKRYLNDEQFVAPSIQSETFAQSEADRVILADTTPDYRVMSLVGVEQGNTSNAFNENNTAYWHKSVGGYHAAKLRRYQELIDYYIQDEMREAYRLIAQADAETDSLDLDGLPVLNMLNTRYFLYRPFGTTRETLPVLNRSAYGNAWFVSHVRYVADANEEIAALEGLRPVETAVVDVRFRDILRGAESGHKDSLSVIRLTSYAPDRLTYECENGGDGVAVFSEIYYPDGWQVTIDGEPVSLARADYVLRALPVPAGRHVIEMRFDPQSLHVTETLAWIALGLMLLGVAAIAIRAFSLRKSKKQRL